MSKYAKRNVGSHTDADQANLAGLHTLTNNIKAATKNKPGQALIGADITKTVVSMEGYSESDAQDMVSAMKGLESSMESFLVGTGLNVTDTQREAAVYGAALAADPVSTRRFSVNRNLPAMEGVEYISPSGAEMFYEAPMRKALESYDERDNRHVTTYSTVYNMVASRQGPFAEMFFPTINVAPDQVGFETTIRINSVMSEVKSSIDGAPSVFNKKSLIQAAIDPDIFTPDQTKVVPVYRDESKAKFVADTLVTPHPVLVDTESVMTSFLKMGVKVGLLPISQTEALLKTGTIDYSDALDVSLTLDKILIKLTGLVGGETKTEAFEFSTKRLPTAVFTHALQGLDRQMNLAFKTEAITFSKNTKTVSGAASELLAVLGNNIARVNVGVSGEVNLQTSDCELWARPVTASIVLDEGKQSLPLNAGVGATISALLNTATVEGYEVDARRVNTNQRQRGQLLDTVYYNQIYTVPLRAPMSIPRPRTSGEENDASDLAALITATHHKINAAAVQTLLEAADFLEEYVSDRDSFETAPAILGVARHLVTAYFRRKEIDVTTIVQSLTSMDKRENISAAIVSVLRDYIFNAIRDSGWQAAADSLAGGDGGKPLILIGTDPVIASYLCTTGDGRLLGTEWDVQVETTLNKYMKGRLIVSFGQKGSTGKHNPMHFGNMAYRSELALVLPTHRNGQNSKELMVTPSYLHIVNLPIMMAFTVTGLTEVATGQVAVPTKEVV